MYSIVDYEQAEVSHSILLNDEGIPVFPHVDVDKTSADRLRRLELMYFEKLWGEFNILESVSSFNQNQT